MYLGPVLLPSVGAGALLGAGAVGMGAVPLLGPWPSEQWWQVPFTQAVVVLPPALIESPPVLPSEGAAVGAAVVSGAPESGESALGVSESESPPAGGSGAPASAQRAAPALLAAMEFVSLYMDMSAGLELTFCLIRAAVRSNGRAEGIFESGRPTQTLGICEGAAATGNSNSTDERGRLWTCLVLAEHGACVGPYNTRAQALETALGSGKDSRDGDGPGQE